MRLGLLAVVLVVVLAGCRALPPPPVVAFHGETAAAPRGSTTAMIVVGVAGQILGGDGYGLALRVEHQETARTALGIELTGGRGQEGGSVRVRGEAREAPPRHWLVAVRGYGRGTPRDERFVALTYGAGLSVMDMGLVTLTAHGGGAFGYANEHASPYLGLGAAVALPLRRGRPWGSSEQTAGPELYLYFDLGAAIALGDTNRLSLDLGMLGALDSGEVLIGLSLADGQRAGP
jgi:hypothetical protein